MRKLLLLSVLLSSGCGMCKTHIAYEVKATHVHAPVPVSSVSMKITLIPVRSYEQQGQRQDVVSDIDKENAQTTRQSDQEHRQGSLTVLHQDASLFRPIVPATGTSWYNHLGWFGVSSLLVN